MSTDTAIRTPRRSPVVQALEDRSEEVLRLLRDGKRAEAIVDALGLSPRSVRAVRLALSSLGFSRRLLFAEKDDLFQKHRARISEQLVAKIPPRRIVAELTPEPIKLLDLVRFAVQDQEALVRQLQAEGATKPAILQALHLPPDAAKHLTKVLADGPASSVTLTAQQRAAIRDGLAADRSSLRILAEVRPVKLTVLDLARFLIQERQAEVVLLLDQGRNFDSVAELIGFPVDDAPEVRRAVHVLELRRRRRMDVKLDLLDQSKQLIRTRLAENKTYKEILAEIGNPELTVPDLTRYVVSHKLPARQRGLPRGRRHGDPEIAAQQTAYAIHAKAQGRTLEEIGKELGQTKESIRQKLQKAGHPSPRQMTGRERLKVIPTILPMLASGMSYDRIANAWNKGRKPDAQITWNFVAALCAAAEKQHYERLSERLKVASVYKPGVAEQWDFLPKLLPLMAEIRSAIRHKEAAKPHVIRRRKPEEIQRAADDRRERLAKFMKGQPKLFMTTMAANAKLKRSDVRRMVYGEKGEGPSDDEWVALCSAYPALASLGYEMVPGAAAGDREAPKDADGAEAVPGGTPDPELADA